MPLPLYLLALAVFAMGTSEFMLSGLLPDIAADLAISVGTAGSLTPAFAIGMVVGAPVTAALARRWPARTSLLVFIMIFALTHVVGAMTASFPVLLATRVVAALANAGFLAVALSAATSLVPMDRVGRALAVLLSGTTLATIVGVPGGAFLGVLLDWRATFWAVAVLCLPAFIGVLQGFPSRIAQPSEQIGPSLRAEIAQLARPRLVLIMVLAAVVNGATFATFTFLAPIVTGTAGLDTRSVPVVLVVFGLGSFAGVTLAGRLSSRHFRTVVGIGGTLLLAGWIALAILADSPAHLVVLVFVQGTLAFAVGTTLIARVLTEAAAAPTMGGSYATAALNVGAAGGPLVAAAALTGDLGETGPIWASSALVAAALIVAVLAALVSAASQRFRPTGRGTRDRHWR